jgi:hypothetical protein
MKILIIYIYFEFVKTIYPSKVPPFSFVSGDCIKARGRRWMEHGSLSVCCHPMYRYYNNNKIKNHALTASTKLHVEISLVFLIYLSKNKDIFSIKVGPSSSSSSLLLPLLLSFL